LGIADCIALIISFYRMEYYGIQMSVIGSLQGEQMLIDSHAHLDAPYFRNKLPAVLQRARDNRVRQVVTIGVTPSSTRGCIRIAESYPFVHATAGYHPHWSNGATPDRMAELERHIRNPHIVALGEIGLDFHHFRSPREDQIALFNTMLDIAVAVKLPIIVHDRKAHADVYRILANYRSKLTGGVIHCFSGDWQLAQKYLDWGFFLSIPGTVTNPRAKNLREVARKTPLDRLLLETDAPHLSPIPRKTRKNEPAFLYYTAKKVAELRNISFEALAEATSRNVHRVYRFADCT
jgi:TatD DNase family protein